MSEVTLYLADTKAPPPLGLPQGPRDGPSVHVGSQGKALSYERGTPVRRSNERKRSASSPHLRRFKESKASGEKGEKDLQGYLTCKKTHPPRTLP